MKQNSFSIDDTNKIKGFAIILMIIHHCFLGPERYAGQAVVFSPLSEPVVNKLALAMKVCVAIFTFLSAYGMTVSYKKKMDVNGGLTEKDISAAIYRRTVKLLSMFIFIFMTAQLYSLLVVHDHRYALIYGKGIKSALLFVVDMLGLAELFGTPTFLATFWYISMALIIIFVLPVFYLAYRRFGAAAVLFGGMLIGAVFPVTAERTYAHFPTYAFTVALGMICADRDVIRKISGIKAVHPVFKFVIELLLILMAGYARQLMNGTLARPFWEGIVSLAICAFFYEFVDCWPVIKDILAFLGKHSANIFLIHNFIRIVWYYDFTYSFHNWLLIAAVLLILSLLVSVLLETAKKLSGYNKLTALLLKLPERQKPAAKGSI